MDVMGALAVVTQGLGIAKSLNEIKEGYDTAEFKAKMAELMSALADAKVALIEANDAIRQKDREIERLQTAFEKRADTVERFGYRFPKGASGEPSGDAFCPRCDQNHGRLYRLVRPIGQGSVRGDRVCPDCGTKYGHVPQYD